MATNLDTVYAYAQCLSVHGFSPTREEAQAKAKEIEPMQVIHGSDYWEHGYVIEIAPGQLSDRLYQGSDGTNDYIIWNDDTHYTFYRPLWMRMGNPATARPTRKEKVVKPALARPSKR